MNTSVAPPTRAGIRRTRRVAGVALAGLTLTALLGLTACSAVSSAADDTASGSSGSDSSTAESPFDLTTANVDGRPRIDPVPEAVEALKASGFKPIQAGKFTVAHSAYEPPLGFLAEDDNTTLLGVEPDIAQLVADGLGLEYTPENVAWADWPLGVESGKYDAVVSNVTVTEERKELFDFAIHRDDVLAFAVKADNEIDSITEAKDVAGLRVVVGSGTNQEKILLDWFAENEKAGLEPGEPVYYEDNAAAQLALASGRVDAIFGPNPTAAFAAALTGESKVVGTLNGGFPLNAQIGVTTKKGNGLAEPVAIVLNSIIESGVYADALERWDLSDEAVTESLVNPPGLPKP
ncbi:ABC transporter substrate-binding protein [Leucobacter luti]|nr:ABC transporter substrate-binding protein [Leucobacter luti]MCW2289629.1 polar amino acid transport system substrate-binding protein [Leucobacter luti]QYM77195.1 ABC transporter substrate-binding protein [Leucobacter luti]TCK37800.1 amino acid ABC transporter substrate-binding protein (PAAT family) [Leucobacter luti]